MNWIVEKMWFLNDVFEQYPRVFWLSMIYMVLAVISPFLYAWVLGNFFSTIFEPLLIANIDLLRWGLLVIPLSILIYGLFDCLEQYEKLSKRKHRY